MSSCCNTCSDVSKSNNTSLSGLTDIIDKLVEIKIQAALKTMNTRFDTLEAEMKKLKELVKKAEDAADVAVAAKEHAMTSVASIDASMAEMSEKLKDGFNIVEEIVIGTKRYFFKHGILVRIEDV